VDQDEAADSTTRTFPTIGEALTDIQGKLAATPDRAAVIRLQSGQTHSWDGLDSGGGALTHRALTFYNADGPDPQVFTGNTTLFSPMGTIAFTAGAVISVIGGTGRLAFTRVRIDAGSTVVLQNDTLFDMAVTFTDCVFADSLVTYDKSNSTNLGAKVNFVRCYSQWETNFPIASALNATIFKFLLVDPTSVVAPANVNVVFEKCALACNDLNFGVGGPLGFIGQDQAQPTTTDASGYDTFTFIDTSLTVLTTDPQPGTAVIFPMGGPQLVEHRNTVLYVSEVPDAKTATLITLWDENPIANFPNFVKLQPLKTYLYLQDNPATFEYNTWTKSAYDAFQSPENELVVQQFVQSSSTDLLPDSAPTFTRAEVRSDRDQKYYVSIGLFDSTVKPDAGGDWVILNWAGTDGEILLNAATTDVAQTANTTLEQNRLRTEYRIEAASASRQHWGVIVEFTAIESGSLIEGFHIRKGFTVARETSGGGGAISVAASGGISYYDTFPGNPDVTLTTTAAGFNVQVDQDNAGVNVQWRGRLWVTKVD
jgi:hypothetical protein